MKKKTVRNLIMIAIIILIVTVGLLGVGYIQGWFDATDGTQAVVQETHGVINLVREGVSFPMEDDTILRSNDQISCQSGASVAICFADDRLILGEKASVTILNPATDSFSMEVHAGEVFAHCDAGATLRFEGKDIVLRQATALVSVRTGAQSVSVLRGTVHTAGAGQSLQYIAGKETVGPLALESLNDFTIAQIRRLNDASICFTSEDLDRLAAQRHQALQDLINDQTQPTASPEASTPTETTQSTQPAETTKPTELPEEAAPPATTNPPETTAPVETTAPPPETTAPPKPTTPIATKNCTVAIYCDTILNNMGDLEPGKAEFVPADGVILAPVVVKFSDGETVFDVLKRVCDRADIQLEYSWTPLYDSYYVEGINNLYEFDCGFESGWMYKVNGWFPNYGCSSYTLKEGDVIVWCYTCKGLGADVGAPRME